MPLNALKRFYYDTLLSHCHRLAERFLYPYLALVTIFAITGFLFLTAFPVLLVISTEHLYQVLAGPTTDYITAPHLAWLLLLAFSTLMSFRILTLRFPGIEGIGLRRETTPKLFKLLDELQNDTHYPVPNRVVVTDRFELQIIKTPEFGIPLCHQSTLVIGLPILLSLSPNHFRCALAHKLAQFNGKDNTVTNWLYQLRDIWKQYLTALSAKKDLSVKKSPSGKPSRSDQLLYWFFALYTPFYRCISIPAAQYDELLADQKVLDTINNDDLFKAIESLIVAKIFLQRLYWPSIHHVIKQNPKSGILPYTRLEQIIQSALPQYNIKQWLEQQYNNNRQPHNTTPSLKAHMEMLGRSRIKLPDSPQQSAAKVYLDTAYRGVIKRIDDYWVKRQRRNIKKAHIVYHQEFTHSQNTLGETTQIRRLSRDGFSV